MFDNTKNTQTKTEDDKNCENSFGGFGGRLSYEQSASPKKNKAAKAIGVVGLCAVLGLLGVMCGMITFRMINSGKELYYPGFKNVTTAKTETQALPEKIAALNDELTPASNEPMLEEVTEELAAKYRVPAGVMLRRVNEDSEAHRAGLNAGDIIVSIDGIVVRTVQGINELMAEAKTDSQSHVKIFRDNEYVVIKILHE